MLCCAVRCAVLSMVLSVVQSSPGGSDVVRSAVVLVGHMGRSAVVLVGHMGRSAVVHECCCADVMVLCPLSVVLLSHAVVLHCCSVLL